MEESRARRRTLWYGYGAAFTVPLMYSLVTPVIPLFSLRLGASSLELGLIGGVGACVYVFFVLLMGRVSDRIGRKTPILSFLALYGGLNALYSLATLPIHMIALKVVEGFALAMFWPSVEALIADSSAPDTSAFAPRFNVVWSVGALIGALLAAPWTIPGLERMLFRLLVGVAWTMGIIGSVLVKEDRRPVHVESLGSPGEAGVTPGILLGLPVAWIGAFTYAFVQGTFLALYPAYARSLAVPGPLIAFAVFLYMGGRVVAFAYSLRRPTTTARMASLQMLVIALAVAPLALTPDFALHLVSAIATGVGAGIVYSYALAAALTRDPGRRGVYAGVFESSLGIGFLVGPVLGGAWADVLVTGPYFLCVMTAAAAFLISLLVQRRGARSIDRSANIDKRLSVGVEQPGAKGDAGSVGG